MKQQILRRKYLPTKCLGAAALLIWLAAGKSEVRPVGTPALSQAPGFSVTDISGKPLSLAQFKGKVVLLNFWATWCAPCRIEVPGFVDLMNRYHAQGLEVVGISMDDATGPIVHFSKDFKVNYPVALGSGRLTALYGGIMSLPVTFVIDREGRIHSRHFGGIDFPRLEPEIRELLSGGAHLHAPKLGHTQSEGKVEDDDADDFSSEVPGMNLKKVTPAQKQELLNRLEHESCPCDCKLALLKCRQEDHQCGISLKLARAQLNIILNTKN